MSRHKFPETHGMWNAHRAEYQCWQDMIQRCHNPSNKAWGDYGKRGIYVCERWKESFVNFFEDMGQRPDGMSLDRINNDGPYAPENCRWATTKTQNRNRRDCIFIDYLGKRQTIIEWAEETGIDRRTILSRFKKGLPPEAIFSQTKFTQHRAKANSKSKLIGASPYKNKWKSQIKINGVVTYLGLFDTPEEASSAYLDARQNLKEKNHENHT